MQRFGGVLFSLLILSEMSGLLVSNGSLRYSHPFNSTPLLARSSPNWRFAVVINFLRKPTLQPLQAHAGSGTNFLLCRNGRAVIGCSEWPYLLMNSLQGCGAVFITVGSSLNLRLWVKMVTYVGFTCSQRLNVLARGFLG